MLVVNYDPDHMPRMSDFSRFSIPYSEEHSINPILRKIELEKQVLLVIPCEDGLVFVIRETESGAKPPYGIQQFDD